MKLKDLYMTDDDLFFMGMADDRDGDDDEIGYRREKKDHDKRGDDPAELAERLEDMSKEELRRMVFDKGIDERDVDLDSKKSMRKAIMKAAGIKKRKKDEEPKNLIQAMVEPKRRLKDTEPLPYYLNEDTGDFVIPDALSVDGMVCYEAMQSLAFMRAEKRPEDGFAEMIRRLGSKIHEEAVRLEAEDAAKANAIDVPYTVVEDKPAEAPAAKELPASTSTEESKKPNKGSKYRK